MKRDIDKEVEKLISKWGWQQTIAALGRLANSRGLPALFNRFHKLHVWLTQHDN